MINRKLTDWPTLRNGFGTLKWKVTWGLGL